MLQEVCLCKLRDGACAQLRAWNQSEQCGAQPWQGNYALALTWLSKAHGGVHCAALRGPEAASMLVPEAPKG
eukprot:4442894-Alexandrium_andersonii.AAC.1